MSIYLFDVRGGQIQIDSILPKRPVFLFLLIQVLHGLDSRDGREDRSGFSGSLVGSVHTCDRYPGRQTEGKARHRGGLGPLFILILEQKAEFYHVVLMFCTAAESNVSVTVWDSVVTTCSAFSYFHL